MSATRRTGFTLVEVVIALAITALLTGLVLAAVQRVRAAAARAACANNLRQTALALAHYHHVHHALPPGTVSPRKPGLHYLNWQARLLPFVEQQALWEPIADSYRRNPNFWRAPWHTGRDQVVRVFGCPADARVLVYRPRESGLTSFMGVSGRAAARGDGLLFADSAVRFADVADGLSNTLVVGERPPSADLRLGWWYAGWGQPDNGFAHDAFLGVTDINVPWDTSPEDNCPRGPYRFGPGRFSDQCDTFHFWSPHPGGAHFTLADGSVRFLSYSSAPVLPALSTRAGGEGVPVID